MIPLHKTITLEIEKALGAVLLEERRQLDIPPRGLAARAELHASSIKAFERGRRLPSLATFITLAWCFNQDPRELFDKMLLRMRRPPGSRPVIHR